MNVFDVTGEERYLDAASKIGNWITTNLFDSSTSGYGGYFVVYPDEGQTPKVIQKYKSTENNADIYAVFSELARVESSRGNAAKSATSTQRGNMAGDFVMSMFDRM